MLAQIFSVAVNLLATTLGVTIIFFFVKLHSELANPTELQLDGVGVDFVFPPSQEVTTTSNNPHQNLPEGSVIQAWNLGLRLNSQN